MPELSQDAIRELRQSLPLLERLVKEFARAVAIHPDDILRLQGASDRVRALTSTDQFEAWVGGKIAYGSDEEDEDFVIEILPSQERMQTLTSTDILGITEHLHRYAHRLYPYVQGIADTEEVEEKLDYLTEENANLKEQLAELRQRESIYLSTIREAQTSTIYSPPPDRNKALLASLERQRAAITKNLYRYQEQKAQYGPLDVPPHILNAIDQLQEELKPVDNTIAYLKANITEMK